MKIYLILYIFLNYFLIVRSQQQISVSYNVGYAIVTGSSSNFNTISNIYILQTAINYIIPKSQYTILNPTTLNITINSNLTNVDNLSRIRVLMSNNVDAIANWSPAIIEKVSNLPTQGGQLSITGYYFDPNNSQLVLGGNTFTNVFQSDTLNIFNIPSNLSQAIGIKDVSLNFQLRGFVAYTSSWSYNAPSIDSVTINDQSVTITGSSFGSVQNWLSITVDTVSLQISSFTEHLKIILSNNDQLKARLVYAGLHNTVLTITDKNSKQVSANYQYPVRPVILNVTSASSDTPGLITVTGDKISSTRFDGTQVVATVKVGQFDCNDVESTYLNSNQFSCVLESPSSPTISDDQLIGLPVVVTIDGASSINTNVLFNFDMPVINGSQQVGNLIEFTGQRLGLPVLLNTTYIIISNNSASLNHTQFSGYSISLDPANYTDMTVSDYRMWTYSFQLPANFISGTYSAVITTHNNLLSSNTFNFTIRPDIGRITQPKTTGGEISIYGALFSNPTISINYNNSIDLITCNNTKLINSTLITCTISKGSGTDIELDLTVNGQLIKKYFNYQAPTLNSSTPLTSVGGVTTISGDNFAPTNFVIMVENIRCPTQAYIDDRTLTCTLSSDDIGTIKSFGSTVNITVTVNGQSVKAPILDIQPIIGASRFNWLPIALTFGIITLVFIIATTVYLSFVYLKKEMRRRAVMKFINS